MNARNLSKLGFALVLTALARDGCWAADPDLGPRVLTFEPGRAENKQTIQAVFKEQERAQFGSGRHALFFKPGRYELDVPVARSRVVA